MSSASDGATVVRDLTVSLSTPRGRVNVVEGVGFSIAPGEMLGLVGESGSGKSVTGAAICGLLPATMRRESGDIRVAGVTLTDLTEREMESMRGSLVSTIPQDPMTSLDPAFTIGHQVMDVLRAHGYSRNDARSRALEMLRLVKLSDPEHRFHQYPHEISGGMRQRVLIAMAICCEPSLLIADEPTTALDATIQAQILDLLRYLNEELGMATILTTHDLAVARQMCNRVVVMYGGQIMESGDLDDVFCDPAHPYTEKLLIASAPVDDRGELSKGIPGQISTAGELPPGCRFHPRCEYSVPGRCDNGSIALVRNRDREVRCVRAAELELRGIFDERPVA